MGGCGSAPQRAPLAGRALAACVLAAGASARVAVWALPLAGRPAGPERRVAAGVGFEPAGNTASDRAARHRAWVQSRGMKTGSAAKAGRPMFSGEMKKTFEKAAGREEAACRMA